MHAPFLRRAVFALGAFVIALALIIVASRDAFASFPPAGTDVLPVAGQVSITSRIGQETIQLAGTATFQRQAPHFESGFEVQSAEITALNLSGNSVTGPVYVGESSSLASTGELRAQQTGSSYPASSYFDVYATVTAPASPGGSTVLHNNQALHFVAASPLFQWPPYNATYGAAPAAPGVLLYPSDPKAIYITSASFTVSGGVGGITGLTGVAATATRDSHNITTGVALGLAGGLGIALVAWWARRSSAR